MSAVVNEEDVKAAAHAACSVLQDLGDRSGIGDELDQVDNDVRIEIQMAIGGIIAQAIADARAAENRACEDVAKAGHPHCLACCMCADFTTEAITARRGGAR